MTTIVDILSTDLNLLRQLKKLFVHQQACIASRDTRALQESSQQMDEIAMATEQNNRRKAQYLQASGMTLSEEITWEAAVPSLITGLSAADAGEAGDILAAVNKLARECQQYSRDNQKAIVLQMTLTSKTLNRLRGPAIDNGSAYYADGSTQLARDSMSLAMA